MANILGQIIFLIKISVLHLLYNYNMFTFSEIEHHVVIAFVAYAHQCVVEDLNFLTT